MQWVYGYCKCSGFKENAVEERRKERGEHMCVWIWVGIVTHVGLARLLSTKVLLHQQSCTMSAHMTAEQHTAALMTYVSMQLLHRCTLD